MVKEARGGGEFNSEIASYYEASDEAGRLEVEYFPLERARTQELILRFLPATPAVVLDVGGAAGAYAYWLAARGYDVHLVDPVSKHVRQAEDAARGQPRRLASIGQGDARALAHPDGSVDAVLLLGPLYHLVESADRLRALGEAFRVLKPGGWLFAAGISRFASLVDGLRQGNVLDDPAFAAIVENDLRDGRHLNSTGSLQYFTTAYFHRPEELQAELAFAGFASGRVFAVEGPGFVLKDFAKHWAQPESRESLLVFLRKVEEEPALLGASPHLLAVGHRPA